MKKLKPRILFVTNDPGAIMSHKIELIKASKKAGYEVAVASPAGKQIENIKRLGIKHYLIHLQRKSFNPLHELRTLFSLFKLYRKLRPSLIQHFSIKPVIYGTLVARIMKINSVVNGINGLGYIFISKSRKVRVCRKIIGLLYKIAFKHKNMKLIFQNKDDEKLFLQQKYIKKSQAVIVRGSGVNLSAYQPTAEPIAEPIVITLAARMLWDKGINEFVEAAKLLKQKHKNLKFILVGGIDEGNPAKIESKQLLGWQQQGIVEWWGYKNNIAEIFAQSHIVCLPSYREGLPKSLLEAAACARPIVTSDVPGCREIVIDGFNGLLAPAKNLEKLVCALETLVNDSDIRKKMGERGRKLVEENFTIELINAETISVYNKLLNFNSNKLNNEVMSEPEKII